MSNIINRVTRTSVATNESMVGQKVTLLDGSRVTITGVASSSAYAHDGGRARISAYLLVKAGRNFKQIEQADVDGKVTDVEDAGGYAHYTFVGKRKPAASTKPDPKPAGRKPAASTKPDPKPAGRKPASGKKDPKPAGRKPAASTKPDPKPASRKPAGNRVKRNVEIHEMPEALATIAHDKALTTKNVNALRREIQHLLAERYGVGMFDGLELKSESHFNSEDNQLIVNIGFDFSPYLESEEEEAPVDVDDATEQLLKAGIVTVRALRSMSDDEIIAAYREHFTDAADEEEEEPAPKPKGSKVKAKPAEDFDDEFDDENEEEEEDPDGEEEEEEGAEIAHINLPASMFSGTVKPKMAEAARVMGELATAWEVNREDIFPGILLQYDKVDADGDVVSSTEVAFVGLAVHKGHTSVMVVDTETMEDEKPRRIMIKLEAACERCSPLVLVDEEEQEEEADVDNEESSELDVGDFELDLE